MVSEKQRPNLEAGLGTASCWPDTHRFVILASWKVTKIRSRRFS